MHTVVHNAYLPAMHYDQRSVKQYCKLQEQNVVEFIITLSRVNLDGFAAADSNRVTAS